MALVKEAFTSLNCHQIGTIVSFDAAKQSAVVTINMKRVINGVAGDYPLLLDVPVISLFGGAGYLTFPITAGDTCLVLFNDRDIDSWWTTGGASSPPNSPRLHDISDGIALVGIRPASNPKAGYSATSVELGNGTTKIKLEAKVGIQNSNTSLLAALDLVCTAMSTLNSVKTGGSAASDIGAAKTAIDSLLE